jgi:hypothetical protein
MRLADRCKAHVKNRLGFELDFTAETLGVLDFFVNDVLKEEGGGVEPPLGDPRRAHLVQLLAPTIGAYFGEVLCRVFPCRWRLAADGPQDWLLEFENVPLRLNPVGAAAEAFAGNDVIAWRGELATSADETELLAERLAAAPPVPENEFFNLAPRYAVLQIAEDWLRGRLALQDPPGPEFYSTSDYDRLFAS